MTFRMYVNILVWLNPCLEKIYVPVACFAAGHFRVLLRSAGGPPSQTNWMNPWHEILHDWNARVARQVQEAGDLI